MEVSIQGTQAYMSHEMWKLYRKDQYGRFEADIYKSDMFSLGLCTLAMLHPPLLLRIKT